MITTMLHKAKGRQACVSLSFGLASALAGTACNSPVTTDPVVVSLIVSPADALLEVGATAQFRATLRDAAGDALTGRTVTWFSSAASLATVSTLGLVTAMSPGGPITIRATSEGQSGTAQVTVIPAAVASVAVSSPSGSVAERETLQFTVALRDTRGALLAGRAVTWSSSNTSIATVSSSGLVTGVSAGGPITITANSEGQSGVAQITVTLSPAVTAMFQELGSHISWALSINQSLLPLNPGIATQLQAKIAMLQRPTLVSEIMASRFFTERNVTSTDGRQVPIVAVFPLDSLRPGASQAVPSIELALPLLEDFIATSFPTNVIRIWYGFIMGNRGGGGTIYTEDRGTYEARTGPARLPYESILDHELSHTYIGHESLTQFLAVYLYNLVHTNSTNLPTWIWVNGYQPWQATNDGVHALLDVYQLIGRDAMANAYRTIYPLRPPYGVPLSAECKQAFIDQAPAALKAQVAAKMAMVTF